MKSIDEMFKEILEDNKENKIEVILSTILDSDKPVIINIYLGDE